MPIASPSSTELGKIAADLGFHFDPADIAMFREMMRGALDAYAALDRLPDALPQPRYARLPGTIPAAEDNPFGAFARITEIPGAASGPLSGKRIVVKDCTCVAGVPMMNGSSIFEGYVPEIDATVVTRMLDAGGTIVGKSANEDYCYSGGSHTNARGPVDNPHRPGFSAGGSSSGSGALVGGGVVDMALGTDQGGSVRQPASFCGVVGMKATFGLVPCTGNLGMEYSLDHLGPITRTVADNALLLEVIAGPDGLDGRQNNIKVDRYTADLGTGAKGLRIGILDETFGLPQSDKRTDAAVRGAVAAFRKTRRRCGSRLDTVAPLCRRDLDAPRRRRLSRDHVPRQRLRLRAERRLSALGHAAPGHVAPSGRSACPTPSSSPCWSANICFALTAAAITAARTIWRVSCRALRSGADARRYSRFADGAVPAAAAAGGGCAARRGGRNRLRRHHQHRAVQRHRASVDEHALRLDRRTAGRPDADRAQFR